MHRHRFAPATMLATPLGRAFRAAADPHLSRLGRRLLAVALAVAAAVSAQPEARAQTDIQIHSLEVIQQAPGNVHEDYRRGWTLNARVQGVNPKGSAGGLLYLSVKGGPVHPATFGRTGHSLCVSAGDPDIILSNDGWLADLTGGDGVSAGFQLPAIGTDDDDAAQSFTHTFSFGTICDDTQAEPDETFTVRAWFEARGTSGRRSHKGAGLSRDMLIIDYDETGDPPNLTVTATGSTSFRASWDAPDSGLPSGWGYQLEHRGVGAADTGEWTPRQPSPSNALSLEVTGLRPGATYRVRVRSYKNDGTDHGDWTPEEEVTLPTISGPGVPTVPLNVEGYLDGGKPAVVWDPPANADEARPAGYEVQWRTDVDRQWRPVASTGRKAVLSEVGVAGRTYEFRVRASNDGAPWSPPASVTVPVVEVPVPGVPLNVEAYLDGGKPAVVWDPPANQAEALPTGYEVQWRTDVDRQWRPVASTGRKAVLSEVGVAGRTYEFRVRASNDGAPWSPPASVTVPVVEVPVPGVPLNVEAYLDGGKPAVVWDPPANQAEAPPTGYEVQWRTDVDRAWSDPVDAGSATSWTMATAGVPGSTYEFRVRAVSTGDLAGEWSGIASIEVPPVVVPGLPQELTAVADGDWVRFTWAPPENADAAGVTAYHFAAWPAYQDSDPRDSMNATVSNGELHYIERSLDTGCAFRARVRAVGVDGPGSYAFLPETRLDTGDDVCEAWKPGVPRSVSVRVLDETDDESWTRRVDVGWQPPAGVAADVPIEYFVSFESITGGSSVEATAAESPHEQMLAPGEWRVTVIAFQSGERGDPSSPRTVDVEPPPPFTLTIESLELLSVLDRPDICGMPGQFLGAGALEFDRPVPFALHTILLESDPPHVLRVAAPDSSSTLSSLPGDRVVPFTTALVEEGCLLADGETLPVRVATALSAADADQIKLDVDREWRVFVVGGPATPVPVLPVPALAVLAVLLAAGAARRRAAGRRR